MNKKIKKDFSILIGGEAGEGSRKAGFIIAKLFSELGYRIFIYDSYQSLIKGGHSFSHIRASNKKVLSPREKVDFLLALNKDVIKKHGKKLDKEGMIIYNSDEISFSGKNSKGLAIKKIVEEAGGIPIMKNIALIAGFAKTIGIDWKLLEKVFKEEFNKFQDLNLKIAKRIFNETENLIKIRKLKQKGFPLLTGNEALSLGAVKAGLDLYIAYPMTPATGILHYLAKNKKKFKIIVSQLENEVGIVNAAIGAAYAGARTMIGTSGGGFALMTEGLSLAVQSENPLVIVESQRMSPGTGVATYNGQGDLLFVLNAGHGDIIKFVIAPGDADEACFWSGKILNLSWKYQTPSILLIDKEISENTFSFDESVLNKVKREDFISWNKKGKYLRYKDTKSGISPLAFPGEKKVVSKSNSYEHDEFGITVEDEKSIEKMQNKRLRKFREMKKEIEKLEAVKVYGEKKAKKAIIAWGSVKGPAKEAAEKLRIKIVQPLVLEPFPEKQMRQALKGVEKIALVETNGLGQMEKVLSCYGIKVDKKILKYNARPFLSEEIEKRLSKSKF
jgi:2-oxoglutarate/2-oxoacid ferredoxin oxidoreductase subunit alpha